jgi:hypothetical protein
MNLIEKYGSYEAIKQAAKNYENSGYRVTAAGLELYCLEYRRQHNIFEVGDKVVWINSIAPNDPRLFEVEDDLGEKPDTWSLRHATDEEIKAGKRL